MLGVSVVGEQVETSSLAGKLSLLGWNPDQTEPLTPRDSWVTPRCHSTWEYYWVLEIRNFSTQL